MVSSSNSSRNNYGIYNQNTGTIIIGNKSSDTVSKEVLNIKGKYTGKFEYEGYGLYNKEGNVEFYNGKIEGDLANDGVITKIREGYKIEKNTIDDEDIIYLVEKIEEEYIVQIEDTKYYSLQEAINSIGENEKKIIQVIKDFELQETIEFNKNIILDLNGYTVTNNYWKIVNTKELKITDTTENKEGRMESTNTIIGILNKDEGNIEIAGGTVSSSSSSNNWSSNSGSYSYGIYNASSGNVTVTGGTASSTRGYKSYGIYNGGTGDVIVRGGTVSGFRYQYL